MWAKGPEEDTLNFLRQFSASLAADVTRETNAPTQRPGVSKEKIAELSKLVARCYLKQGQWQVDIKDDWSQVRYQFLFSIDQILKTTPIRRGTSMTSFRPIF